MISSSTSEPRSRSKRREAGHYEWHKGELISDRFTVTRCLGDGTFGRVLQVRDNDGSVKALKVIRAVPRYINSAKIQARTLLRTNMADPQRQSKIALLLDEFPLNQNYCLLFEKLGPSLFDIIQKNKYNGNSYPGFPLQTVKEFARQMLQALEFTSLIGLTHTDIKPENILLAEDGLRWNEVNVWTYQENFRP